MSNNNNNYFPEYEGTGVNVGATKAIFGNENKSKPKQKKGSFTLPGVVKNPRKSYRKSYRKINTRKASRKNTRKSNRK